MTRREFHRARWWVTLEKGQLRWNMAAEDFPRLAALLAGCAISMNSDSTLFLNGTTHGKPVIFTCFDANNEVPWWEPVRRLADYHHLVKLIALGGVRVTRSYQELRSAIDDYLADPRLDS